MCACMHGAHALHKYSASKYPGDLACMQADSNLEKITTTHFGVLNTQNANENMPNMIPIPYLNENFVTAMRIWHGVNKNPLFIPMCFGTQNVRKQQKLHFTFFHVVIITFKSLQIVFFIEYQHTSTVEHC